MPHQCIRCKTFYEDSSQELESGCDCGSKLFLYIGNDNLEQAKKAMSTENLNEKEKAEIESNVREIVSSANPDDTIILDLESVRVIEPGKYELDLVNLFKGEPLVFKLEEGKYMIDLVQSFKKRSKKKR